MARDSKARRSGPDSALESIAAAAEATSAGFNPVAQLVAAAHVVPRAVPLINIVEAPTPLPATNPAPCTASGKLSTAPAKTLDGEIISMLGPLVIATVALTVLLASAALVAITVTAFGEGADVGEV